MGASWRLWDLNHRHMSRSVPACPRPSFPSASPCLFPGNPAACLLPPQGGALVKDTVPAAVLTNPLTSLMSLSNLFIGLSRGPAQTGPCWLGPPAPSSQSWALIFRMLSCGAELKATGEERVRPTQGFPIRWNWPLGAAS